MQTLNHAVDVHPFGSLPHLYRGVCAYRLGRYRLAFEDINFCLGQSPRSQLAVYRGMVHAAASQSQQALKDFNIAIQLDKANGDAYLQRAILHTNLKRFAEATKDLQDAHVNGVNSGEVLYRAATVHAVQSQNDAARAAAEAALKHLPNHAGAKELLNRLAAQP
jgi:tetratricopeptide (TPR) repeat protein